MFMGQYNHTVDVKGRLSIPSKFREQLGDEFVITKGMDGCLFVFDNNNWSDFEQKLAALPMGKIETRQYTRFFLAGATSVELDKQGRILVPNPLRGFAGLEKDVVLVGVGNRIEIWSLEKWEEMEQNVDMDEITAAMADFGLTF